MLILHEGRGVAEHLTDGDVHLRESRIDHRKADDLFHRGIQGDVVILQQLEQPDSADQLGHRRSLEACVRRGGPGMQPIPVAVAI